MKMLYTIVIACLLLVSVNAVASRAPRTPMQEKQAYLCQRMEEGHPACNVCLKTYSESQARLALWIQIGVVSAGLGLILAWIWVMRCACCKLKLLCRILRRGRERRAIERIPLPPGRAVATLKGPFGTMTAAAIDISTGGMQVEITQTPPKGMKGLKDAVRTRTALALTVTGRDGVPVLEDAACRAVWVCEERAGLAFRNTLDITPLLEAGLTRSGEPK